MRTGPEDRAEHPSRSADLAALIGLASIVEGELMAGHLDVSIARHLRDRLAAHGLVATDGGTRELRQALSDLTGRLRYDLGEHREPHRSEPVPVVKVDVELPSAP